MSPRVWDQRDASGSSPRRSAVSRCRRTALPARRANRPVHRVRQRAPVHRVSAVGVRRGRRTAGGHSRPAVTPPARRRTRRLERSRLDSPIRHRGSEVVRPPPPRLWNRRRPHVPSCLDRHRRRGVRSFQLVLRGAPHMTVP